MNEQPQFYPRVFPIVPVLTIVFLVLKLTKTIDWSWLWVLSPVWIGGAFSFVMLLLAIFLLYLAGKLGK